MSSPKISAVATAVPQYAVEQNEIKKFAALLFECGFRGLERLLGVFEHGKIKKRYLSCPLEWYGESHSFSEANSLFEQTALVLAEKAARQALLESNVAEDDIGAVISVTSTGISTPTLDAKLIQRLGLSLHTLRIPVWGLGCAGGVVGLARAANMVEATRGKAVLLVAVELCSLTFQREDFSKSNLVGASLFADGAAAVIISCDGEGPEILGSYSTLFPETEDVMGWDVVDGGLKVRFSRDIPSIVRRYLPDLLEDACSAWGVQSTRLRHFILHPGGAKVVDAYSESLGLNGGYLAAAYRVLENYGNMSSASVFFVLKEYMKQVSAEGEYGVMVALGPGFSAEQVLFRW